MTSLPSPELFGHSVAVRNVTEGHPTVIKYYINKSNEKQQPETCATLTIGDYGNWYGSWCCGEISPL